MLRILVVANGNCNPATIQRCCDQKPHAVICVDGGLRHCVAASVVPDVLVGDLDSADSADVAALDPQRTHCIRYSADKDATDLELALQYVNDTYVNTSSVKASGAVNVTAPTQGQPPASGAGTRHPEVCLVGISGGRTDHMLANWLVLSSDRWLFDIVVEDRFGTGYLIKAGHQREVMLGEGATFSLLALTPSTGIHCSGAKYPLIDASLYPDSALGISNVSTANYVRVSVKSGAVLLYANNGNV